MDSNYAETLAPVGEHAGHIVTWKRSIPPPFPNEVLHYEFPLSAYV